MCLFTTFTALITDVETDRFTITFKLGFNEAGTYNFVWVISDFSACNDHSLSFTLRVQFSTHLKTLILDIFHNHVLRYYGARDLISTSCGRFNVFT